MLSAAPDLCHFAAELHATSKQNDPNLDGGVKFALILSISLVCGFACIGSAESGGENRNPTKRTPPSVCLISTRLRANLGNSTIYDILYRECCNI
jgi:hypothetical protein